MDVHNKKTRSFNMSRIRSKNTRPELLVRKFLFLKGFRFRIHSNILPGQPDIVLSKHKTIIFIHGCFWHGHDGCKYYVVPKTRTEWWEKKIDLNRSKDKMNIDALEKLGWNVKVIWECELKSKNKISTLNNLLNFFTVVNTNN